MPSVEDFKAGMEYINGKIRATIRVTNHREIYVYLYTDYPSENEEPITFFATIQARGIRFDDVFGNGHGSNRQDRGYGTLITNIAVELSHYYARHWNDIDELDGHWIVTGRVSNVGDENLSTGDQERCQARRQYFWESKYHFNLRDREDSATSMEMPLSQLQPAPVKNGLPDITLDDFWLESKRPILQKHDYDAFMGLDPDEFSFPSDSCLTKKELNKKQTIVYYTGQCLLCMLCLILTVILSAVPFWFDKQYALGPYFSLSIGTIILAGLFMFKQTNGFDRFWCFTPGYRSLTAHKNARSNSYKILQTRVCNKEKSFNGIIWRVYDALLKMNDGFSKDEYQKLCECSVECHWSDYAFDNTEQVIEHYREFILDGRKALKKYGSIENNIDDISRHTHYDAGN